MSKTRNPRKQQRGNVIGSCSRWGCFFKHAPQRHWLTLQSPTLTSPECNHQSLRSLFHERAATPTNDPCPVHSKTTLPREFAKFRNQITTKLILHSFHALSFSRMLLFSFNFILLLSISHLSYFILIPTTHFILHNFFSFSK